jgi:hypothetical protein
MSKCGSKCLPHCNPWFVPHRDAKGKKIMYSDKGNKKFPIPYTKHAQCTDCWLEDKALEDLEFRVDIKEWLTQTGKYTKK